MVNLQENFNYYISGPVSKYVSSWMAQPEPSSKEQRAVAHDLFMEAMENIGQALKNIGQARRNSSAEQFIKYMRTEWNQWLKDPQPVVVIEPVIHNFNVEFEANVEEVGVVEAPTNDEQAQLPELDQPVLNGKNGTAKPVNPMNLSVTRETVLEKNEVHGILFGLLNQAISQYSSHLRSGHSRQKITKFPLKESLELISELPLREQAKLYFASQNGQFKARASHINNIFGRTFVESLRNELKWNLQATFRCATAADKNQFRAVLSDAERHDLGVRAARKPRAG